MKKIVLCSGQPILIEGFRAPIQNSGEFAVSVCRDPGLLPELVTEVGAHVESCLRCLRQVAFGQFWLEHELSNKLIRTCCVPLTMRQRQLVGMRTQGLRNKQIADRPGVTEGAVKVYLEHL